MKPYIYLRGLRHVDLSVFCVENGQKVYWDPVFSCWVPYSSGQQVKRSILDTINSELLAEPSPVTFVFDVNNKGGLGEGEVLSLCDPLYYDQLLGGWMKAAKGGAERTLKRRSPFPFPPCVRYIRCWEGVSLKLLLSTGAINRNCIKW